MIAGPRGPMQKRVYPRPRGGASSKQLFDYTRF